MLDAKGNYLHVMVWWVVAPPHCPLPIPVARHPSDEKLPGVESIVKIIVVW